MNYPFTAISPDDPRLASVPDAPGYRNSEPGKVIAAPFGAMGTLPGPPKGYFIQRSREQRSPDRQASIERRRRLAQSGVMPPSLGAGYTVGELAVLKIVADEFLAHGVCDLSRNEIAARAGCSYTLAKRAMRIAKRDGRISAEHRPRSGRKHLSNLTRIIDAAWLAWLAHGNRRANAIKNCERTKPTFKARGAQNSPPRAQIIKTTQSKPVSNHTQIPNKPAAIGGGGLSLRKQE